jgi:catechol 2,3-dioxygenase
MTMHIGHVALRVTDLERAVAHVTQVLGLYETSRDSDQVLLSSNEKHHELQLLRGDAAGLDHIGLEVESASELDEVRVRATAAGAEILPSVDEDGLGQSVRLAGPAGMVFEIYDGMTRGALTLDSHLKPQTRKLGHLTFFCADPDEIVAFWRDGLCFRVSDQADGITWMRCDSDHHGLAVGPHPGGANVMHHHAWEVQDWGSLAQYCDSVALQGMTLLWGPVRHGPGFNLAAYVRDAEGAVIEVYAELIQIRDERAYEPIDWSDEPRSLNLWGPGPSEELLAAGIPILPPAGALSSVSPDDARDDQQA